ncbi:NAD(+)/NADH kinase [soil metagenome]
MNPPRSIAVFTRRNTAMIGEAVVRLAELSAAAGVQLLIGADEVEKLGLEGLPGVQMGAEPDGVDLAIVRGVDGTILSTLRRYAGRDVPVFAMNFGEIGFLATVERDGLDAGFERALHGDFEVLCLPALTASIAGNERVAVNDISFHRRPELRVAELGYSVADEAVGGVRCDGLVVSTPAGSTGYNLANGGPVLAWGVSGYVVSFIAPHTLTARALVVAPDDVLEVVNRSRDDPVDVTTDGRLVCSLEPRERVEVCFSEDVAQLAQVSGATFYRRLREKFGRLTS